MTFPALPLTGQAGNGQKPDQNRKKNMNTETRAETEIAKPIAGPMGNPAPVLIEKLGGGKGIVRVGDIVTPRKANDSLFNGWTELTVTKASAGCIIFKGPDGVFTGGTIEERLYLTSHSELQARTQLESIREMVVALKAASDKLLTERAVGTAYSCDVDAEETAREAIQQDALEVTVRSGWKQLGELGELGGFGAPAEFCILLCTGGPAVRIIGDLDEHGEPEKARIEHQDWGTPWTEYRISGEDEETLLTYCREFCFAS